MATESTAVQAAIVTSKSIASVGVYSTFVVFFNDAQSVSLLLTGLVMGVASYYFDWAHTEEKNMSSKEMSELMKALLYSVAVIFFIFHTLCTVSVMYIEPVAKMETPAVAIGAVAALIAGNAVKLIEWFSEQFGEAIKAVILKLLGRIK
jgi:hypothetical protein